MIEWDTVKSAVAAWVLAATGLPPGRAIWSQQGGDRPGPPFVEMRFARVRGIGLDWQEVVEVQNPTPGQELQHRSRGVRELLLTLKCFAPARTGATGAQSAVALLERVVSTAALPTRRAALGAAGVGVVAFGPVLAIDGVVGSSVLEPRATLEARCHIGSEVSDFSTYIETVELTNELTESTFVVELENA